MKILVYILTGISVLVNTSYAQQIDPETGLYVDNPLLANIDSVLKHHFAENDPYSMDYEKFNKYGYAKDFKPEFSDSIYRARIAHLDANTPFEFEFNEDVLKYIHLFAKHRRSFTSICLGRTELYFPLYEEKLDKYGMPMELKYLSVIESALNPKAKSRAGATGLWQFMLATGKQYGLNVTSYTDDRFDPEKATEAACQYLTFLHKMYGDWSMALAAYNAGPGNVNRAIRRSGGEMTYWKIRNYLPRETQGYVPTFIAVTYMMTYAAEHNIYPRKPDGKLFNLDTVQFNVSVSLDDVAEALDIDHDYLVHINPIYKTNYVPASDSSKAYLYLPHDKIGDFMLNLDTLSRWQRDTSDQESFIAYGKIQTHTVSRGESLGTIAYKHNTTVSEIMTWNNLSSKMIHPGQVLKLHVPVRKTVEKSTPQRTYSSNTTKSNSKDANLPADKYNYYTIRSGDTLWDIANKKGVSVNRIKELNPGLSERNLKIGQRIKIGVKG